MDIKSIDWNQIWKEQRAKRHTTCRGNQYWNKRAPSFAEHVPKTGYADAFLKIIKPKKSWTVLDMGCGAGTLALPLSSRAKEITAVDFSDTMIELLNGSIHKKKIRNIKTIKASWEDNWDHAGIGEYDIAIASRSLAIDDIRTGIEKLNNAARKRVYISTVVGDGPHDSKIFKAIGRNFVPPPDYIYLYNLLYKMGIIANISFITEDQMREYDSHETAQKSFTWMLNETTKEEEERLAAFLHKHLIRKGSKWIFDYKKTVRWTVIWWEKK